MTAFLALVRTDLRLFFSNRRAVIMAVLAPIVIAAFFGYLFGDHDSAGAKIDIAVVDLDHSDISRQIVTALGNDAILAVTTADAACTPARSPPCSRCPPATAATRPAASSRARTNR